MSALNWSKKQGLISRHCLEQRGVVRRGKRSRGQEAYIAPALYTKLIAGVNHNFADLLRVLHDTGSRPAEAYHIEARYYRPADKVIVYPGQPVIGEVAWKNAKRTGKDRVIHLNDKHFARLMPVLWLTVARCTMRVVETLLALAHGRLP